MPKKISNNTKKVNILIILTIICLLTVNVYKISNFIKQKNFDYGEYDGFPQRTVKYIKENLDYKNIKLYNEFNYGSYLEYNDIPVFIDSRAEVYIAEFNGGQDIVGDFLDISNNDWYKEIFEKYNFDYALVYYGSEIYHYLMNDSDFKTIYSERNIWYLFEKVK